MKQNETKILYLALYVMISLKKLCYNISVGSKKNTML